MKLILTNLLLIFSLSLKGQTELGIGIVSIDFNDSTVLHLYETPTNKSSAQTIKFFNDTSIKSTNIRNLDKQTEWLSPEVIWLDYSSFIFRCKSKKDGWLEVIVNNNNGKTYWLKQNSQTKFSTWETYLQGMFGVGRLADKPQVIRKMPNNNSEELKYTGKDCFQVKSMQEDWIEIFTPTYCDDGYTDSKTKIKSGWIKWRQGSKLLIEYFITS